MTTKLLLIGLLAFTTFSLAEESIPEDDFALLGGEMLTNAAEPSPVHATKKVVTATATLERANSHATKKKRVSGVGVPYFRGYFARKEKAYPALKKAILSKAGQQALQALNLKVLEWHNKGGKKYLIKKLRSLMKLGVGGVGKKLQKYERQLLFGAFGANEQAALFQSAPESDLVQTGYFFFLIPLLIKKAVVTIVKKLIFTVKTKAGKIIRLGKKWAKKQVKKCLKSCSQPNFRVPKRREEEMMLTQEGDKAQSGWGRRRRAKKKKKKKKVVHKTVQRHVSQRCLNKCRPFKFNNKHKKASERRAKKYNKKRAERRAKHKKARERRNKHAAKQARERRHKHKRKVAAQAAAYRLMRQARERSRKQKKSDERNDKRKKDLMARERRNKAIKKYRKASERRNKHKKAVVARERDDKQKKKHLKARERRIKHKKKYLRAASRVVREIRIKSRKKTKPSANDRERRVKNERAMKRHRAHEYRAKRKKRAQAREGRHKHQWRIRVSERRTKYNRRVERHTKSRNKKRNKNDHADDEDGDDEDDGHDDDDHDAEHVTRAIYEHDEESSPFSALLAQEYNQGP